MLKPSSISPPQPVFKFDFKKCLMHRYSKLKKTPETTIPLVRLVQKISIQQTNPKLSQTYTKSRSFSASNFDNPKDKVIAALHNDPETLELITRPCPENLPRVDKSLGHKLRFHKDITVSHQDQVIYPHIDLINSISSSSSKSLIHFTFKKFEELKKELRDTSNISADNFRRTQKIRRERDRFRKQDVRDMNPKEIKQVIQHCRREKKRLV